MKLDQILDLAAALLGLAGVLAVLVTVKGGRLADALVKYLGLRDPDERISNKKVLTTIITLAGVGVFVSAAAKSVALSTEHDVGPNVVWMLAVLLGGGVLHAGIQQKLGGGTPPPEQRRSSGAIPQPELPSGRRSAA